MNRISAARDRQARAKLHLAELIDNAIKNGQRGDGLHRTYPKKWTNNDLAGKVGTSEGAVRLWRTGKETPKTEETINLLLDAFYGQLTHFAEARDSMRNVWLEAKGNGPTPIEEINEIANEINAIWKVTPMEQTEGLAELRLHSPRMANDGNAFYLDATLRLDKADRTHDGRIVFLALKSVTLIIDSKSHQAAKSSLIGERIALSNVTVKPHGIEFTAADDVGYLRGDLLQGEYIASMENIGPQFREEVVVSLVAAPQAFSVTVKDSETDPETPVLTPEKDAILKVLLYSRCKKDRLERAIVAKSRMRR